MAITDWPKNERPREKLIQQGPESLSDAELLAIFLRTGCAGKSAVDLARDLLQHFDSLSHLLDADEHTFCQAKGLGLAKYTQLQAVMEMARRHLSENLQKGCVFQNAQQVKHFLVSQLRRQTREVFSALFLDNQHRLIKYQELFYGTINCAQVHPREVVKAALHHNAAAIIVAHNHPSGDATPSRADIEITQDLKTALSLMEIRLLDHMIVGHNTVTSLAERGVLVMAGD